MKPLHLLAALTVVTIWGFNFVVIKVGLNEIPPILLCALRFIFAAVPAIFFIKRPAVPVHKLMQFGLIQFALQFALLFGGMKLGMSAGLASLALQVHVFVSISLAVMFLGERPNMHQVCGALLAFVGIGVVAFNVGGDVSVLGLLCVLSAATCWGLGNLITKQMGKVDMLALVVWGSLVAPLPLLALSFIAEGPERIVYSLTHISWQGVASVAYLVYPTTLFGFAVWSWLLSRYPAASVSPLSLLAPVVALFSSAWLLGELLQTWKLLAAILVMAGLCINVLGPRWQARRNTKQLSQ
jgi:O-acetylserine/cysteine efflux transporter